MVSVLTFCCGAVKKVAAALNEPGDVWACDQGLLNAASLQLSAQDSANLVDAIFFRSYPATFCQTGFVPSVIR